MVTIVIAQSKLSDIIALLQNDESIILTVIPEGYKITLPKMDDLENDPEVRIIGR